MSTTKPFDRVWRIQIGYESILVNADYAKLFIDIMQNATRYENSWHTGAGETHHIGGNLPSFKVEKLPDSTVAEGIAAGAKP